MRTSLNILASLVMVFVMAVEAGTITGCVSDRPVEELKARWAPPPSQFLDLQGYAIHYRDEGRRDDPIPIVLIHGLSASLHTWEGWVAALKAEHRVISMDLPGSGLTGPNPENDYHIENDTRFMLRFLDALGVQRCILVGNSLGGEIAWHVAAAEPQRVERLVLVDAAGYALTPKSVPLPFQFASVKSMGWFNRHLLPRNVVESAVRNVYGNPARITEELVDRYYELALRAGNRGALIKRIAHMKPGADVERLKMLTMPTLILWGARDKLIPPEHAEHFHRDIAGSQLVMYEKLGHVPQEEDPNRTVADVQRFLEH